MKVKIFIFPSTISNETSENAINEWMRNEKYPIIRFIQQSHDNYQLIISVWYDFINK